MESVLLNSHKIHFCPFDLSYTDQLLSYYEHLSHESKKRFAPHPFTKEDINNKSQSNQFKLYIAPEADIIVAYAILKNGWVDFDAQRFINYGLKQESDDWTIAPSVADSWQSRGLGSAFFKYILNHIRIEEKAARVLLWGGVQSENHRAIHFYKKFGFTTFGEFDHNGNNFDMMLIL